MTAQEREKLIEDLFEEMSCQIGVMAEYGDDEEALREELETSDDEILLDYKKVFLDEEEIPMRHAEKEEEARITVKDYGSNIDIWVDGDLVTITHDGCCEYPYDINMKEIMKEVARARDIGKVFSEKDKKKLEEKIGTWVENHSCSDDDYYDDDEDLY